MILFLPENDFFDIFQFYQYEKYKRPFISNIDESDIWYRYLKNDTHKWLKSNKISYSLIFDKSSEKSRWLLDIPDSDQALMFKLTWL